MKFDRLFPLADQITTSGGNFLVIALCAHALPMEEQGKVGILFSAYIATILIGAVSMYQYANIHAPRVANHDCRKYYAFLLLVCLLVTFIVSIILALSIPYLANYVSWQVAAGELEYFIAYLALQQFVDFYRRTAYIFKTAGWALFGSSITYIPRIGILAASQLNTFLDVLYIMILTSIPGFVFYLIDLYRDKDSLLKGWQKHARTHFREIRWLVVAGPFTWLWAYIPVFVLGNTMGLAVVGAFVSVRSISNVGNTLMEILETSIAARAGVHQASDSPSVLKSYMRLIFTSGIIAWLAGLLFLFIVGKLIILITIGSQYEVYDGLLILLWGVVGLTFVFRVNGLKLRTEGRAKVVAMGYVVATIIVIIATPYLVGLYGVYGAAISLALGAFSNIVSQAFFAKSYFLRLRT